MHHIDIVVEVAAVVAEDGVSARREARHNVVARELAARMHQVNGSPGVVRRRAVEDAEALRRVGGIEIDDVAADGGIKVGEGERQAPDALLQRLRHGAQGSAGERGVTAPLVVSESCEAGW